MSPSLEGLYDQFPFPPFSHVHTRVGRLRSIAMLHGLTPPGLPGARVLELGCGVGWNLIPMAYRQPETQFLGIDLSSAQIDQAKADAAALGLDNLEFRHQSILDLGPGSGKFDYILAHGVLSWVPQEVGTKIFQICQDLLAATGVAYVSYNCYPGWHFNDWIRKMMLFGAQSGQGSGELARAMAFLAAVSRSPNLPPQAKEVLANSLEKLGKADPAYVLHDHLELFNQPLYFSDFASAAASHGLQYVADAEDNADLMLDWPPALGRFLPPESGLIQREQCSDFLRNRNFRKSLLCPAHLELDRTLLKDRIKDMWMVSSLRQAPGSAAQRPGEGTPFTNSTGDAGLLITQPTVKAALLCLQERAPVPLHFRTLWEEVRPAGFAADDPHFIDQLLQVWRLGFLDLQAAPGVLPSRPGERPEISAPARLQATRQDHLTNLEHGGVRMEGGLRNLVPFIDGSRTRPDLARQALDLGLLRLDPSASADAKLRAAQEEVDRFLALCCKNALLVA